MGEPSTDANISMTLDQTEPMNESLLQDIKKLEEKLAAQESSTQLLQDSNALLRDKLAASQARIEYIEGAINRFQQPIFFQCNGKQEAANQAAKSLLLSSTADLFLAGHEKHKEFTLPSGETIRSVITHEQEPTLNVWQNISDLIAERNADQQKIQTVQKTLEQMFARLPCMALELDSDGKIVKMNSAATSRFASYDDSFFDIVPEKALEELIKSPNDATYRATGVMKSQKFCFEVSVLYTSSNTTIIGLLDNTKLEEVTMVAKNNKEAATTITELPYSVMTFDSSGNTLTANKSATSFFKQSLEKLQTRKITELFDLRSNWRSLGSMEVFSTGSPDSCFVFLCVFSTQKKSPRSYIAVFRDITKERHNSLEMKMSLKASAEKLKKLELQKTIEHSWEDLFKNVSHSTRANLNLISQIGQTTSASLPLLNPTGSSYEENVQSVVSDIKMVRKSATSLVQILDDLENVRNVSQEQNNVHVNASRFLITTMKLFKHTCLQQMQELQVNQSLTEDERIIFTIPSYLRQLLYVILVIIYRRDVNNTISLVVQPTPQVVENATRLIISVEISNYSFDDIAHIQHLLRVPYISVSEANELDKEGFLLIKYLAQAMDCVVTLNGTNKKSEDDHEGCCILLNLPEVIDSSVEVFSTDPLSLVNNSQSSLLLETVEEQPGEHEQSVRRLSSGLSMTLGQESQEKQYHCLAVDDNKMNLLMIKRILQSVGVTVTLANDGYEAQRIVQEKGHQIDVILLDIIMPGISGYEVCRKIRETFLPIELPIILLTAKGQVKNILDGFECGANDYLTKPFHKLELVARLFSHVRLARINAAYNRFVPRQFLELLGKDVITNISIGDHAQLVMPVMFTDIRSFTSISEELTPKQVFDFLNILLEALGPVIRDHDGFIDKYIGDAIMALFPSTPFGAVSAAIDIIRCLNGIDFAKSAPYLKTKEKIRVGVGVHTGPLIIGTVGECERMDTTVIADTVNIASRIEGLTKAFGVDILITENVLNDMTVAQRTTFCYRCVGKLLVKGKKIPIVLYEVFEADIEPLRTLKLSSAEQFDAALSKVMEGCYSEAKTLFEQMDATDSVVSYYLYFCDALSSKEGVTEVVLEKDGLVSQVGDAPIAILDLDESTEFILSSSCGSGPTSETDANES